MQGMNDPALDWTQHLTDEQRHTLALLEQHKCRVHGSHVPSAVAPDIIEYLLEIKVDGHALVRERGPDVQAIFDRVATAARVFLTLGHG
jgi:hypothetical protein